MRISRVLLVVVVLLALAFSLSAQVEGRISGTIVDPSGSPIPGATVNLLLAGGASPILTTTTTTEGLYRLVGVRPGTYDLTFDSKGFRKGALRGVIVNTGRETPVPALKLELGAVSEVVEVAANLQNVQTANAEISTTVTTKQIQDLPLLDRDPVNLIMTQAGVVDNGNGDIVINGQRTSFTNMTLDGINIQDNYIRSNGTTFTPNLLLMDQVAEVTLGTSNTNAGVGGGASQLNFVTPSGTNDYHGKLYWFNRNSAYAANDWFANRDGLGKERLNQNQLGGAIGGPILKDKLFFYTNYEAYRYKHQTSDDATILTDSARRGLFTYKNSKGAIQQVNILQAMAASQDPTMQKLLAQVPGPEKINNFRVGDSLDAGTLLNTAGYSFLVRDNSTRDNFTSKLDYVLSTKNVFSGSFVWNRQIVDRSDASGSYGGGYSVVPTVANDDATKFLSIGWRWNPTARITNELRGGFNIAPADFSTSQKFGNNIIDGMIYDNPVNTFRAQGRGSKTYTLKDDAAYERGKHNIQFGFQMQVFHTSPYDDNGITPIYSIGNDNFDTGLGNAQLPGAGSNDLYNANWLLASLAGYVYDSTQTFNVTSRTSGFVNGAGNRRNLILNDYAGFVQDSWKAMKRLTLTLGLRYEYYSVLNERDSLYLMPVLQNNNVVATLLSNSTLDFAGSSVGRPWYRPDRNNFAPNLGFAWDVFGNGKTAIRGGYSIHYVNDETLRAIDNNVTTNAGLSGISDDPTLTDRVSSLTPVKPPPYKVPRTFADNYANSPTSAFGMPDPNLRTPYVQEWNFGIEHDFKGTIVEARYIGSHGVKEFRAFDYNQVIIKENGFLDDFQRAQRNGYLAQAAKGGAFNPAYDSTVPGSQPLPVFGQLKNAALTNSTVRNYIQQGQVGELANYYQTRGQNGSVNFYRNKYALGCNTISNYSNSSYNAFQFELRRHAKKGLDFGANYTFSKVLSDSLGNGQARFEAFLDMANPKVERARAPFDITHALKIYGTYDLPFGKGHALDFKPLSRLISGWKTSGFLTWQTGSPFSVLSGRGTLNRSSRSSATNTANSNLTGSQLDNLFQFSQTPDGPMFVASSALYKDGRAVAPDGQPAFAGQAFSQPGAGTIGALQRRMFNGPIVWNADFAFMKDTRITERQSIQLRMDANNLFNHPTWWIGDQTISSTNFGTILYNMYSARVIQFGLTYKF